MLTPITFARTVQSSTSGKNSMSMYRHVPTRKFLPTLPRFEPLSLDHSVTKTLKECPRKYFYRYVLGRVSREEKNKLVFAFGNAIHAFFEEVYKTENFDLALGAALKKYKAPGPLDTKKAQNLYSVKRLMMVCKECWEFFGREKKQGSISVIGIEQPFNVDLPDGTQTGGRFDQIIQTGGHSWIRDWKTTSTQVSYFAMGFNPNDQATRYIYALSRLAGWTSENPLPSRMAKGIYFTVIQNMETEKSLKIETIVVTKSIEELIDWEKDQLLWYKTLSVYRELDHWPKSENNCSWCDYHAVCKVGSDSSREFMLKDKYDLKPWDHEQVTQAKILEDK